MLGRWVLGKWQRGAVWCWAGSRGGQVGDGQVSAGQVGSKAGQALQALQPVPGRVRGPALLPGPTQERPTSSLSPWPLAGSTAAVTWVECVAVTEGKPRGGNHTVKAHRDTLPPPCPPPSCTGTCTSTVHPALQVFGEDIFSGPLHDSVGRNRSSWAVSQKALSHRPSGRPGGGRECMRRGPDVANLRKRHHNCDSPLPPCLKYECVRVLGELQDAGALESHHGGDTGAGHPAPRQVPAPLGGFASSPFSTLSFFDPASLSSSSFFPLSIPLFPATFRPTSSPQIVRRIVSTWGSHSMCPRCKRAATAPHTT